MNFTPQEELILRSIKKSSSKDTTLQWWITLIGFVAGGYLLVLFFLNRQDINERILPFVLIISIGGFILLSYVYAMALKNYNSIVRKFILANKEQLEKEYPLLRDENIK